MVEERKKKNTAGLFHGPQSCSEDFLQIGKNSVIQEHLEDWVPDGGGCRDTRMSCSPRGAWIVDDAEVIQEEVFGFFYFSSFTTFPERSSKEAAPNYHTPLETAVNPWSWGLHSQTTAVETRSRTAVV